MRIARPGAGHLARFLAIPVLFAFAPLARTEQPVAPLFLVQPPDVGYEVGGGVGIVQAAVGAWVQSVMNKHGVAQINAFHAATAGVSWEELAATEFACVGLAAGAPCREVVRFEGTDEALTQKLQARGLTQAPVLTVIQLYDGAGYKARATLRDVELQPKGVHDLRRVTAIYQTLAPQQVLDQGKSNPSVLWDFWNDHTAHSRIIAEGRRSMKELPAMLTALDEAIPVNLSGKPPGWKDLKPIKALVSEGRVRCPGMCGPTKVFREGDDRLWLASTAGWTPSDGWSLVSIDAETARANSNFAAYAMFLTLEWKWSTFPPGGNQ